jgi:uncharacterized protein YndB with AHSA1/START domain/DNA-binding transcriptional ArsR family regulator
VAPHDLDKVFRALADRSRRLLLDALYACDGQTLSELYCRLPHMTRFGVMKHLRLLAAAGLITSDKLGRERMHYLDPIPIRLIHDCWIRKYDEPSVNALAELKSAIGESMAVPTRAPRHVYVLYIRANAERLWHAITSPEYTTRYFYGGRFESTWQVDAGYRTFLEDGTTPFEGKVLAVDAPTRLVYTYHHIAKEETARERPSRVTWEVAQLPDVCKLTVIHDQFGVGELATFNAVGRGWPFILSGLKTLLETGQPLTTTRSR